VPNGATASKCCERDAPQQRGIGRCPQPRLRPSRERETMNEAITKPAVRVEPIFVSDVARFLLSSGEHYPRDEPLRRVGGSSRRILNFCNDCIAADGRKKACCTVATAASVRLRLITKDNSMTGAIFRLS
jgi:hypothetical protein